MDYGGRSLGFTGAGIITTSCIGIAGILSWVAVYEVILCRSPVTFTIMEWMSVNSDSFNLQWAFLFDDLSVVMCAVVLTVSTLVHIYSLDYMSGDPHGQRFMSQLSLFTAFMILLVTGNSLAILFAGWEGIGISSFLLIGFWLTRVQAAKSAIKAMTVNRVGDMFLTLGLFMMFTVFGSLDFAPIFANAHWINAENHQGVLVTATLLMLIGGMAKSAQVPLHTWLAAAMEGPTPVSALIHAATLVTAGVYLMLRVSPVLEYASTTVIAIAFVGAITAIFAATSGMTQTDIKRVIAYSTCSQVGYMFISLGLGQYNLALYHLANHAAFKAMLFMAAGAIIHAFIDQQDLRRYGGLVNLLPFVYTSLLIGSLSLMAMPYITGWYSKDGILEVAIGSYNISGTVVYVIGTIVAALTAFYSVRLILITFLTQPRSDSASYRGVHEANIYVIVPLVVLSVFAIGLGYVSSDLYRGIGTDFLSVSAPITPSLVSSVDAEFSSITLYKLTPFLVTILGSLTAYWVYMTNSGVASLNLLLSSGPIKAVYRFFNNQWNFDALIIDGFILKGLRLGHGISKVIDRGILEALGPYGLQQNFMITGSNVAQYSTGILTDYAMYIVLGMLAMIVCFTVPSLALLTGVSMEASMSSLVMILMVNTMSAYIVIKASSQS